MKTLIVYYSRTGTTRKVAEHLAKELSADIEEIIDLKNRNGPLAYMIAGKDAMKKKLTRIRPIDKKPSKYDLIIIGGPVWAWTLCPAIRSYAHQNRVFMNNKHVAFFCTMGKNGDGGFFSDLEDILELRPKTTISLLTKDVWKIGRLGSKLQKFVKEMK